MVAEILVVTKTSISTLHLAAVATSLFQISKNQRTLSKPAENFS
jgi:hypothetical protein